MAKTITPLFARVVVKPEEAEEKTASGIVLPDTVSQKQPARGEVIATGPDCKAVKKGDIVLFKEYSPTKVEIDKVEYYLVDEEDLLGTIS
jgi:chaperonin GroES